MDRAGARRICSGAALAMAAHSHALPSTSAFAPFLQGTIHSTGSRVITHLLRLERLGIAVDFWVDAIGAGGLCQQDVLPLDQRLQRTVQAVVK